MRFFLKINKEKNVEGEFSFSDNILKEHLPVERKYDFDGKIFLTTLSYQRDEPGLIEKNWDLPFYNDPNYFIFIGGYILSRNKHIEAWGAVPSPNKVLEIFLKNKDLFHASFKGCYYVVILNKSTNIATIISSPMFMHPAFYSFNGGSFTFSNYIGAIALNTNLTINKQGLLEYVIFDNPIGDKTVYNEIFNVQGGREIVFENGIKRESIIYDIANWYTENPVETKAAKDKINLSLKTSINNYIENTKKFNISLTGGFDGRLNFSFIPKAVYNRLNAVSYGLAESKQVKIPTKISKSLGFTYKPIFLNQTFEESFTRFGYDTIIMSGGITGFNRALYPYAYNKIKDFSRSCILGQCDMIRPLFGNPAGIIINERLKAVFNKDRDTFIVLVKQFVSEKFYHEDYYSEELILKIYDEIVDNYITNYSNLSKELQFYFFLMKENIMKYWHTEFHVVDIFVDDYVSFADLDYLEELFKSKYAGIYKGLFASNQFDRKNPHDLYIDLMSLNNNKLNYFFNDRYFMPGWLKFGTFGWAVSGLAKKLGKFFSKPEDTFDMVKWDKMFYHEYLNEINSTSNIFNNKFLKDGISKSNNDSGDDYSFNRILSLKLWFDIIGLK